MPAKTLTVTETAPFVELPSNWKCRVSCDGAELAREATHTIETLSMAYAHRASVKADPVAANTPSKPSELTEVHVALSGGSTPKVVYENFARTKFFRQMVDRHCALHFWYGDVRMVPDDSADSNAGMVLKALDGSVPPTHIHPVRVDLPAEEAARAYEAELRQAVDEDANGTGMPAFDILMLGMGGDGHCASLFPKTPAPDVRDRVCTTCTPPEGVKPAVERVTVTAPVIEAAKNVVLIVAGAEKRDALRGLLATDDSLAEHPDWLRPVTRLLRRCRGNVYLLVDKEAAAGLFSIANPCEDHDCKEQQQPQ